MNLETQFANLCRPSEEESLVCSVVDGLLSGDSEAHHALLSVPVEAFTSVRAREVWEAMGRLYRAGQAPDLPAIRRELWQTGRSEDPHLTDWLDAGTWGNIPAVSQVVTTLHQRRELFKLFQRASAETLNLVLDHQELAQATATQTLGIVATSQAQDTVNVWEAVDATIKAGLKFRESQDSGGKLAWFGIPILDGDPEEGGIPAAPGHVVIVAARPGLGKTALATQIVGASAIGGECVFMISLELGRWEMLQRLAGWFSDTRRGAFGHGTYCEFHAARLRGQKEALQRVRVWDPAGPSWSRIEAKIRGAAMKGFRVIVIDHFSEIDIKGLVPKGGKRSEGAMECARRMKVIAKELGICIVLLAQLNREVPPGEIPGTEHLRETGELEQIAYSILVLYYESRPSAGPSRKALGPDAPPPDVKPALRMALIKNRDGKAGYTRRLDFDGGSCRMVAHA
jgi:replicative DNA helicase